jgi:peptide/nickel transport system ATP-binding protein
LSYYVGHHSLCLASAGFPLADTVSVLPRGRVVEDGPVREIFSRPGYPCTEALLDAISALPR